MGERYGHGTGCRGMHLRMHPARSIGEPHEEGDGDMEQVYPRRDWLTKSAVKWCTAETLRREVAGIGGDSDLLAVPHTGGAWSYQCSPDNLVAGPTFPRWESESHRERYHRLEDSGRRVRFYDILVWPFARHQILLGRESKERSTIIVSVCPGCLHREVLAGSESVLSRCRWAGSGPIAVLEFDREYPDPDGSDGVCACPAEPTGVAVDVKPLRRAAAADRIYLKFRRWMEIILFDVTRLVQWADTHERYRKLVTDRFGGPSHFDMWVQKTYVFSITVMVRAQTFRKRDDVSIAHFLEEIVKHPDVFTRARLEQQGTAPFGIHTGNFEKVLGAGRQAIHEASVRADLDEFSRRAELVSTAASRLLAHRDERGLEESVSLDSLDDAIDCIRSLTEKYRRLYPQMPSVEDRLEPGWLIERELEKRWYSEVEHVRLP